MMCAVMYWHYRDAFNKYIVGGTDRLAKFWEDMIGNPQFEEHPVRHRAERGEKGIAGALHGDGAPTMVPDNLGKNLKHAGAGLP